MPEYEIIVANFYSSLVRKEGGKQVQNLPITAPKIADGVLSVTVFGSRFFSYRW